MKRSTIRWLILATTGSILGGLFFLLTETNEGNEHIPLPRRCVGKLIDWSGQAGLTEQQLRRIFGDPELTVSETHGPIGTYHRTTTLDYLRYGVSVSFYTDTPPVDDGTKYDWVHGGIG